MLMSLRVLAAAITSCRHTKITETVFPLMLMKVSQRWRYSRRSDNMLNATGQLWMVSWCIYVADV